MSNARPDRHPLTPAQDAVAAILGPLDGARVAGGCDHCDAYQTVQPRTAGVWDLYVHHDDSCPVLRYVEEVGG